MTTEEIKEQTKEQIKVMQAFLDGKKIECKNIRTNDDWGIVDSPSWAWSILNYRVKPEPTYQPYDVKTLTEAIAKHGYAVKTKDDNSYYQILKWKDSEVVVYNYSYTYKKFLEKFVWADDGSACGVLTDNNE